MAVVICRWYTKVSPDGLAPESYRRRPGSIKTAPWSRLVRRVSSTSVP
jgi:hypothetical protein